VLRVFFSDGSAAPRRLHSFPTRRSSDLGVEYGVGGLEFAIGTDAWVAGRACLARNGATQGFGGAAHDARFHRTEREAAGVPECDLVAVESQGIFVAVVRICLRRVAVAIHAIQTAQLAFIVVELLARTVEVEPDVVIFVRRQAELGSE